MNYNFKIRYIIIKISKRESERKQKIDKPRKTRSMIALKQNKLYQMFRCIWKPKSYKQCLYTRTSPRISLFLENYIKQKLKLRTFIKFYFHDSWKNGTVICFNGVETRKSKKHNPLKIFRYNIKIEFTMPKHKNMPRIYRFLPSFKATLNKT